MNTNQIQEKARSQAKYPYVKPEIVDSMIDRKEFWRVPGTAMTVCCIVLKNGFTVIGTASCVDARNYNEELSKELSFSKARDEIFHYLAFAVLDEQYHADKDD